MQLSTLFVQKKTIVMEACILLLVLGGAYYFYTQFSEKSATTTVNVNGQLLGQNFIVLLKAINQDRISFAQTNFLDTPIVAQLQDFSEVILPTEDRGRADPFTTYASTGSIR